MTASQQEEKDFQGQKYSYQLKAVDVPIELMTLPFRSPAHQGRVCCLLLAICNNKAPVEWDPRQGTGV